MQLEVSKSDAADDVMLVAEKEEGTKRNVEVLNEVMVRWKMKINW